MDFKSKKILFDLIKQNILQRKKKQIYYDTENKLRKYANTNKKNKKIVVKSKN